MFNKGYGILQLHRFTKFFHQLPQFSTTSIRNVSNDYRIDISHELLQNYMLLDLEPRCSKIELKSRYLHLLKRFHPDTGGELADSIKFQKVRDAYKYIVEHDFPAAEQSELKEVAKNFDIKHTAPQHRQYLEFGGVGYGTPSQRLKQYQQHRVQSATENVREFMLNKIVASETDEVLVASNDEAEYVRKWRTRNAMDRLVEDLIQESMRKGEFDNLPGKGKPLKSSISSNPYVDSTTHKLNEILVQNGFLPEWVWLEKEIKGEMRRIRELLNSHRRSLPLLEDHWSLENERVWNRFILLLKEDIETLNKQIIKYNLVVPAISRQIIPIAYEKEVKRTLDKFVKDSELDWEKNEKSIISQNPSKIKSSEQDPGIFKSLLSAMHLK